MIYFASYRRSPSNFTHLIMANERDEVLLQDPNDSEFSGFGPEELEPHSGSNNVLQKERE